MVHMTGKVVTCSPFSVGFHLVKHGAGEHWYLEFILSVYKCCHHTLWLVKPRTLLIFSSSSQYGKVKNT